ncbi:endonuclease/exonuclease/phosphatase family protein [Streptomyces avicenniae]|uniref:endonuclease/exonuclease/phosphatase family protein n=1 Tax=Streptomyces avicenniae TaxID=500153 RepID=UPI0006996785|nr:endonuclease/exonuclease/phosphatase family protein [Streptomyces avicenniae]
MRILTWNLWWRFGPWERRHDAVLAWLRRERPDVCGLQEVWAAGDANLAARLADELGMHWAFTPGEVMPHWRERGPTPALRTGVGVAVLSRWPIAATAVARLPTGEGPERLRPALFALLDAGPYRVPFFTTHLHSSGDGSAVRQAQAAALARFVAHRRGDGAFPPVVTGDLNAEPDTPEVRLLGTAAGLVDAWTHAAPGDPGATRLARNPYRPGPGVRDGRIDYIHTGTPQAGGPGRVTAVRRTGDGPVGGVWPSDHAAVVADLTD